MSLLRIFFACMVLACACAAPLSVSAKEKEAKVSVLMKDANDLMSQAQAAYVNGEAKNAIELYRKALKEIADVEEKNPKRVATSEFAPVRFKKALCETEIDRIMLEEVNATARTVAVTDTTALEAKRAERKKAAETNNVPEQAVKLTAKQADGQVTAVEPEKENKPASKEPESKAAVKEAAEKEAPKAPDKPTNVKDELEFAKDMISVDRFEEAERSLLKVLKAAPDNHDARFLMALARVQQGKFSDATVVMDDLLADNPNDASALLLAAAAFAGGGNYGKAMESLDKAMKVDPKRSEGYHDMAWLLLEMNAKKTDEAEMYYRQAVKLGGARDRDLERRLGIKQ